MVTIEDGRGRRWRSTGDAVRKASDDDLRRIVRAAKPHALRVCLYQLTGDEQLARIEVSNTTPGPDGTSAGRIPVVVGADDLEWLRERAFELLASYRDGEIAAPLPERPEFHVLVELLFGLEIPESELEFWWEEFAAVPHPRACALVRIAERRGTLGGSRSR